jgi:hypothetical protein
MVKFVGVEFGLKKLVGLLGFEFIVGDGLLVLVPKIWFPML